MPKVKLGEPDPRETEIQAAIASGMVRKGMRNKKALAQKIGVPQTTLCYHIRNVREMRVGELLDIESILGFTDDEKKKILCREECKR